LFEKEVEAMMQESKYFWSNLPIQTIHSPNKNRASVPTFRGWCLISRS
jgi:hypothetical protein